MKITLSYHTVVRCKQRDISAAEVFNAIQNPDQVDYGDDQIVYKKFRKNNQLLILYCVKIGKVIKVKTVINTTKFHKYFRYD